LRVFEQLPSAIAWRATELQSGAKTALTWDLKVNPPGAEDVKREL